MATQPEPTLDLKEQIVRIDRAIVESGKMQEETRKFVAESHRIAAETRYMPRSMIFQAMLATVALLGVGAALAKLLFP